jgi:hypothetical protein
VIVYISGPITGMPENNKKAFSEAYSDIARLKRNPRLRNMKIINPLRVGAGIRKSFSVKGKNEPDWTDYMRACIKKLCEADCVYFLEGWYASKGVNLERNIARRLDIPCADNMEELWKILGV